MLLPMVDQLERNTGSTPYMLLADTNYASEAGFGHLETMGLAAYVALGSEGKQRAIPILPRQPVAPQTCAAPPSANNSLPLTKLEASEARNTATLPISSGSPTRPIGTCPVKMSRKAC